MLSHTKDISVNTKFHIIYIFVKYVCMTTKSIIYLLNKCHIMNHKQIKIYLVHNPLAKQTLTGPYRLPNELKYYQQIFLK